MIGLLLMIFYFVALGNDYYLLKTNVFALPLGFEFSVIAYGIVFLLPGIGCMIGAYIMKKQENKQQKNSNSRQ